MKLNKNYIYPFLACAIWGTLYAASKVVLATVPPITVLMFRYIIACVALAFVGIKNHDLKPVAKKDWFTLFSIGFIAYFIANMCQVIGTNRIGASLSSLINTLPPVTIPIMAAVFLREKMTVRRSAAIVLALVGVFIVLGVNTSGMKLDYLGALISFGCVFFFSIGSIIMRKVSGKYSPVEVTLVGMVFALVFNIPASIIELQTSTASFSPMTIACLLYMGIFGTAVAHSCWNKGLKLNEASTCSMFYPVQPIATTIIAALFLNEPVTLNFAIGACVIIAAIFIGLSNGKKVQKT